MAWRYDFGTHEVSFYTRKDAETIFLQGLAEGKTVGIQDVYDPDAPIPLPGGFESETGDRGWDAPRDPIGTAVTGTGELTTIDGTGGAPRDANGDPEGRKSKDKGKNTSHSAE